jgi:hypothetical protein
MLEPALLEIAVTSMYSDGGANKSEYPVNCRLLLFTFILQTVEQMF